LAGKEREGGEKKGQKYETKKGEYGTEDWRASLIRPGWQSGKKKNINLTQEKKKNEKSGRETVMTTQSNAQPLLLARKEGIKKGKKKKQNKDKRRKSVLLFPAESEKEN